MIRRSLLAAVVLVACKKPALSESQRRNPAIDLGESTLTVNQETIAATALLPHLRSLRGQTLAGTPEMSIAPSVSAERELDVLRTIAEAGYSAVKVRSGADAFAIDLAPPGVDALDVTTFVQKDGQTWEISLWVGMKECSVIMDTELADPTKLPSVFQLESVADSRNQGFVMVTPRSGATAAETTSLLSKVVATPLMKALHPKLRFAWMVRGCASDGRFGHAN